jgi:hypothetical protein
VGINRIGWTHVTFGFSRRPSDPEHGCRSNADPASNLCAGDTLGMQRQNLGGLGAGSRRTTFVLLVRLGLGNAFAILVIRWKGMFLLLVDTITGAGSNDHMPGC